MQRRAAVCLALFTAALPAQDDARIPSETVHAVIRSMASLAGPCRFDLRVTTVEGIALDDAAPDSPAAVLRDATVKADRTSTFARLHEAFTALAASRAGTPVRYRATSSAAVRAHRRVPPSATGIPAVLKTPRYDLVYDADAGLLEARTHAHFPEVYEMQTLVKPLPVLPASMLLWMRSDWRAAEAPDGVEAFAIRHPDVPDYELWTDGGSGMPIACWFRQTQGTVTAGWIDYAEVDGKLWPRTCLQVTSRGASLDARCFELSDVAFASEIADCRFAVAPGTVLRDARPASATDFGSDVSRWPIEFRQWLTDQGSAPGSPSLTWWLTGFALAIGGLLVVRARR